MTYALSLALQKAVYDHLSAHATLTGLVGSDIYDAPMPLDPEIEPPDYVTLGAEQAKDRSSKTSDGGLHDLKVTVHSNAHGFSRSKEIASAICDALLDASLTLERGRMIYLRFLKAKADAAGAPARRTIELTFRAFVEDN